MRPQDGRGAVSSSSPAGSAAVHEEVARRGPVEAQPGEPDGERGRRAVGGHRHGEGGAVQGDAARSRAARQIDRGGERDGPGGGAHHEARVGPADPDQRHVHGRREGGLGHRGRSRADAKHRAIARRRPRRRPGTGRRPVWTRAAPTAPSPERRADRGRRPGCRAAARRAAAGPPAGPASANTPPRYRPGSSNQSSFRLGEPSPASTMPSAEPRSTSSSDRSSSRVTAGPADPSRGGPAAPR